MTDLLPNVQEIDLYPVDGTPMGYVRLIDCMPRIVPEGRSGDVAIAQGARVSYLSCSKGVVDDERLIEYLVEHRHTSPLEMAVVKFQARAPLFVFNQLVRHRTASVNCVSRRYTPIPDDSLYVPELRFQDTTNKQGSTSETEVDKDDEKLFASMFEHASQTQTMYEACLEKGVAREVARAAMPQNVMTDFVWKMDLHNFLKMCQLRVHHTAQKEIRELVEAMYQLVRPLFPATCSAYEKHWLNSMALSQDEIDIIRKGRDAYGEFQKLPSKRRQDAFVAKLKHIGIIR